MQVAQRTIPAVVHIEVMARQEVTTLGGPWETAPMFQRFFGLPTGPQAFPRKVSGQGTGMLIDAAGRILTTEHVVRGATTIEVLLANGHPYTAHVVGTDPKTDLAVLTIDAPAGVPAVTVGNSDTVAVGEWVVAIGQPRGLEHTVTQGIVTAEHHRGLTDPSSYRDFLQTDAAITPGTSGGPLVNLRGEVIGVTTVLASQTGGRGGTGFAIPSTMAMAVAHALLAHGTIERAWLGVRVHDITRAVATSLGGPTPQGALIVEVAKGGPAEQAGLQKGDVVVAYQGQGIADADTLRNAVACTPSRHEVQLTIVRGGQQHTLTATVQNLAEATKTFLAAVQERFGVTVRPVSPEEADAYGLEAPQGVVLTQVDAQSVLGKEGLEVQDILLAIDNQPIESVEGLTYLAAALHPQQPITISVLDHRTGNTGDIRVVLH
jgi:serine protease Do